MSTTVVHLVWVSVTGKECLESRFLGLESSVATLPGGDELRCTYFDPSRSFVVVRMIVSYPV